MAVSPNTSTSGGYLIRRIRLINFHNFVDETIEIRNGGHLFLLGDNASGKTTILDAIHYVLTAGEMMEFNSAARVAGNREGGRRVQGVIMRYNVDTGPLNATGAITYAAVEISGRHGNPTTVAVGMTVRSMEEKVSRWGVIREAPLEEIPFLVEDEGGRRPATRDEMRDAFGRGSGYYSSMSQYQREVAQRLFGSWDVFLDACRLMSTGKAYREIVSHTADYHQLFKNLLPEPRTEMFEQIITALKSLDESTADLRRFEDKHAYLLDLRDLVDHITATREEQARMRWLEHHLARRTVEGRIAGFGDARKQREASLAELEDRIRHIRADQEQHRRQIDDLKQKDSAGIITKEKEQAADLESLVAQQIELKNAAVEGEKASQGARREFEKALDALRQELTRFHGEVTKLAPKLPFQSADLSTAIDTVLRHEAPHTQVEAIPVEEFRNLCAESSRAPEGELAVIRHCQVQSQASADEISSRIERLESQEEAFPELDGFLSASRALRHRILNALPVYAGLEWKPGTSRSLMTAFEEAIGEAVLATFVVPEDDYEEARAIVLRTAPGLRVSCGGDGSALPAWMREVFDIARSDPAALQCLAAEMQSGREPALSTFEDGRVLAFRAHERRLAMRPPRLIGQEDRKRALERQLGEEKKRLSEVRRELSDLARREKEQRALVDLAAQFNAVLVQHTGTVWHASLELRRREADIGHREEQLTEQQKRLAEIDARVDWAGQRLEELRARIAEEGLDKLEQRIRRTSRKLEKLMEQEAELRTHVGEVRNQIKGIDDAVQRLQRELQTLDKRLEAEATAVRAFHPDVEDIGATILETTAEAGLDTADDVAERLRRLTHREGVFLGELGNEMKHPVYGPVFGFSYEEVTNDLMDRRAVRIHELVEVQRGQIEEQRQIINERTHEIFRKLIMEGLLDFLSRYVRELRDMVRRINRLLADREFGRSQYRFQLEEVDKYRRLIHIVEDYNPFETAQAEEELRLFFEDHKEAIIETEINEVPDVLDYRNWFHYDMKVQTLDREGFVMDRKTKSVGSGGEQAVPNYLLILTIADFLFRGNRTKLHALLFDEAFYGIDAGRRDQILGFATDIGLQLFVASPDQDGVKREVAYSTTVLVVKDEDYNVHLFPYHWENPEAELQPALFEEMRPSRGPIEFGEEL
jgi:recombinational DNA repair ATPase RecF